jgi:hypothetical protein
MRMNNIHEGKNKIHKEKNKIRIINEHGIDGRRLRWWSWDLGDRGYVVVVDVDVNGFI